MSKSKTHTTVLITWKMLKDNQACAKGIERVADLLPARISTDPEQNINLAFELAHRGADSALSDVTFMGWRFGAALDLPDYPTIRGEYEENASVEDVYTIAQALSWMADCIATSRGR